VASETYLDKKIEVMNLDKKLIDKLKENNIVNVRDLWVKKRKDLKTMKLSDVEINKVIVQLQLNGYDLNKKKY
jgi:hypothetical protein